MRATLLFALASAALCNAQAGSMYKCVGSDGKIAYVTQPCAGQAKVAREFALPAPEDPALREARLKKESDKLQAAEAWMESLRRQRDADRAIAGAEAQRLANARASDRDLARERAEYRKVPTSQAEDCARFPSAPACK